MGGENKPLAARISPTKKMFLSTRPSVAQRHHACPSTNFHQRLVLLIGWNGAPGAAFGAETEDGRGRERMCEALRRDLVAPALSGKSG